MEKELQDSFTAKFRLCLRNESPSPEGQSCCCLIAVFNYQSARGIVHSYNYLKTRRASVDIITEIIWHFVNNSVLKYKLLQLRKRNVHVLLRLMQVVTETVHFFQSSSVEHSVCVTFNRNKTSVRPYILLPSYPANIAHFMGSCGHLASLHLLTNFHIG